VASYWPLVITTWYLLKMTSLTNEMIKIFVTPLRQRQVLLFVSLACIGFISGPSDDHFSCVSFNLLSLLEVDYFVPLLYIMTWQCWVTTLFWFCYVLQENAENSVMYFWSICNWYKRRIGQPAYSITGPYARTALVVSGKSGIQLFVHRLH
jgi:hypothetical protein